MSNSNLSKLLARRIQGTQSSVVRELLKYSKDPQIISLAGGIPAADMFDLEGINEALAIAANSGVDAYQYSMTDGELDLREQSCNLLEKRGIKSNPDEILITSGSQQGLDLVARVLLDKDDIILVERPTYLAALQVFSLSEAHIIDIEGDENGINPDAVEESLKKHKIKALYIVANFANPTGSTLTLARRKRLVELAILYDFIIIEDDPYGEIRFDNNEVPSLYECSKTTADACGRVIYLSSFSKILVPGLRVGLICACNELRERLVIAKQAFDLHTPVLCQRIVAAYLKSGRLEKRIPLLCMEYEKRCDSLINALNKHVGDVLSFKKPAGGMFLWGSLNNIDAQKLLPFAVAQKMVFVPGAAFYVANPNINSIRLSYVTITSSQAEEAAKRLKAAITNYLA
ncbi:GntR family transcriptional regulator [Gammaproteobacteria bacterium]|nr:GntR family transcriptional regulator [Gammaproteobacteria bacterium]